MKEEFLALNSEETFDKIEKIILSNSPSTLYLHNKIYGKLNIDSKLSLYRVLRIILEKRPTHLSCNPENNEVVEDCYDHSTITDIFRIVKHYRPDTKLIDVYAELYKGLNVKEVRSWICNAIGQRTYDVGTPGGFISEQQDEYRIKLPRIKCLYNGGYGDGHVIKNFKI